MHTKTLQQKKLSFKSGDLVYLNRPDCEWIIKIDEADDEAQTFTLSNAVVKIKFAELEEKEMEDMADAVDDSFEDSDTDMEDAPDIQGRDSEEIFSHWQPLSETVPLNYPLRVTHFPYNFIVCFANVEHFDIYTDIIQDWSSTFVAEMRVKRQNTPRGGS